jgi:hypothetical protein
VATVDIGNDAAQLKVTLAMGNVPLEQSRSRASELAADQGLVVVVEGSYSAVATRGLRTSGSELDSTTPGG